jgi:hypothetical protein
MAEQRSPDHREKARTPRALSPAGVGAPLPPRKGRSPLPIDVASAGMLVRPVRVPAPDVVFVKGLLEASEGLAGLFAERGGELVLVAPLGRGAELDELLADLERELGAIIGPAAAPGADLVVERTTAVATAPGQ